jgi:hypothetical protein
MPYGDNGREDYTIVEYFIPTIVNGSITFNKRHRNIQNHKMPIYRKFIELKDEMLKTSVEKRVILIEQLKTIELSLKDDYQDETVLCACGRNYTRKNYSRHIKSHLHVNSMKELMDSKDSKK